MREIFINKIDKLPDVKTDFFDNKIDIFEVPETLYIKLSDIDEFELKNTLLGQSFEHIPKVSAKLLIDDSALQVKFNVIDQYVKSEVVELNGPVCTDSCVEFFFAVNGNGYFNFEINAGGTVHSSFIKDSTRTDNGFKDFRFLELEDLNQIEVYSTLDKIVSPEITEKITWQLSYNVPLSVLQKYAGDFDSSATAVWKGNLYKCADNTSHPHWLTYYPITEGFNFHQPKYFGNLHIVEFGLIS